MAVFILFAGTFAVANPGFFSARIGINGSTSTTSVAYMTPGTGTTTLTFDTWTTSTSTTIIENNALKGLNLAIQMHASSTRNNPTSTLLNWRIEYSSNNIDWYPELFRATTDSASSSIVLRGFREYQMSIASTSASGGGVLGSTEETVTNGVREHKMIEIPVLTRHVRVIFYLGNRMNTNRGGSEKNGGVWAEFIPIRERN